MLVVEKAIHFSNDNIDVADQTTIGLWEVMNDAMINDIHFIHKKEFEKLLAIVNPTHGKDFLSEVRSCF